MFFRPAPSILADKPLFQLGQQPQAVLDPARVDSHLKILDLAVGVDDEGGVGHAQKSRAGTAAADRNKGGNFQVATCRLQLVSHHRTVAGVLDIRIGHIAGVHVIATAAMVRLPGAHRPHQRHVVHLLSHQGEVLADLHLAGGGDRLERPAIDAARFKIPDVDRGRSPSHPEQDHRFLVFLQSGGVGPHGRRKVQGRHRQGRCPGDML